MLPATRVDPRTVPLCTERQSAFANTICCTDLAFNAQVTCFWWPYGSLDVVKITVCVWPWTCCWQLTVMLLIYVLLLSLKQSFRCCCLLL